MNTTPSPEIIEKFPTRFRFTVLSEADVVECVSRVFALIHGVNRDMKSVLTGSPIALGATFTGDDISVANANSKATLLCAVTRLLRAFPRVFYFRPTRLLPTQTVLWFASRTQAFTCGLC
jgi:hypothetical protein